MAKAKTTPKDTPSTTKNATAQDAAPDPAAMAVRGGAVPYLQVSNAAEAAEFYVKAFGAEEAFRYPPDEKGRYMHIHLYVNGSSLMLCDPFPEHGHPHEKPQGFTLHMEVRDTDAAFARAVAAGATGTLPPHDAFWGARYAQITDPFGVLWSFGAPLPAGKGPAA